MLDGDGDVDRTTALLTRYNRQVGVRMVYGGIRYTLMHVASLRGFHTVVTMLLDMGANASEQDSNRKTPLDLARSHGHDKVVTLLNEHMATG